MSDPIAQPVDVEPAEAPAPMPPFVFYGRIRENDAANEYDGGRVVLGSVVEGKPADLLDATLLMVGRTDAFLMQFPWKTRTAKQSRFFRVTIEEIAREDVPPDPALLRDIEQAEARLAALRAVTP